MQQEGFSNRVRVVFESEKDTSSQARSNIPEWYGRWDAAKLASRLRDPADTSRKRGFGYVAIFLAFALVPGWFLGVTAADDDLEDVELKVMTRNLYLGADLTPFFTATSLPAFIAAATSRFAMVQATNFPERAEALADEVEEFEPDLIGLQEVSLYRSQTPADFSPTPNAVNVEFDFLGIFLDALASRGLQYASVAVVTNFDVEVPRFTPMSPTGLQDLRLTDRDVLLARTDLPAEELSLSNAQAANFDTNLVLSAVVGPVAVLRGWVSVDATVQGRTVRVVNAHLEAVAPVINVIQGNELLAGPLDTSLPVIVLGDLNSAADGSSTPTYGNFLAAGFEDAWSVEQPGDPGFTCCQAENLLNPSSILTERIDFVLFRDDFEVDAVEIFGEDPDDKTPSGRWPSDHAGVAAEVSLEGD